MRKIALSFGIVVAVALAPAPARAAEVTFVSGEDEPSVVIVRDRTAAANDLSVTVLRDVVTVRERGGAPLVAGTGCRAVAAGVVRCGPDPESTIDLEIATGPGDDEVAIRAGGGLDVTARGGSGDDRLRMTGTGAGLVGGPGRDVLRGGRGGDVLDGERGADVLGGGAGDDTLSGDTITTRTGGVRRGGTASDVLDGGPGSDSATWEERRSPVRVDLRAGRGGRGGDEDRLRSIESATGGRGADVLLGTARRNVLFGAAGADTLVGLGGADRLDGGFATSTLNGGPDTSVDRLSCGAGRDLVVDVGREVNLDGLRNRTDPVPRDCERLAASAASLDGDRLLAHPHPAGRDGVRVQVTCTEEVGSCRRVVAIRAGGRVVARGARRVRAGVRWVRVRLLRPLPPGVLDIRVHGQDGGRAGDPHDFRYRIRR